MNDTIAASVHQSRIEDKISAIVEQKEQKCNENNGEKKHNDSILVDKKPQICLHNDNIVCQRCN